jgi:hypothetical protein
VKAYRSGDFFYVSGVDVQPVRWETLAEPWCLRKSSQGIATRCRLTSQRF